MMFFKNGSMQKQMVVSINFIMILFTHLIAFFQLKIINDTDSVPLVNITMTTTWLKHTEFKVKIKPDKFITSTKT